MTADRSGLSTKPRKKIFRSLTWQFQVLLLCLVILAAVTLWFTNSFFTERYTQSIRNKSEVRLALYGGNVLSELQRNSIVPKLLAQDAELINALKSQDFSKSTQRLISFVEEIGSASLMLLDIDGRTVASTDRNNLGSLNKEKAYFVDALRSKETVFTVLSLETGGAAFFYSRRIEHQNQPIGVVLVEVDLRKFERAWAAFSDALMVSDSSGKIILATDPKWRGSTEEEALMRIPASTAIERVRQITADLTGPSSESYIQGEAVMRVSEKVPFRGWQITSFSSYSSMRAKVNNLLVLELLGFALLITALFYSANRRTTLRLRVFEDESLELRRLNERLQNEITERQKVEKNLEVAEQSLAQSSKLAALGEMAAAVSHELNQPLAAMKTYLAGAGLLLERNRPEEATSAFRRIDDLIERMGAITKQLKSYARKGDEHYKPIDVREALASSLSMMEPQLKHSKIQLEQTLSGSHVIVMGDRVRLEQVLINLLRNAVDAVKTVERPKIEIMLNKGQNMVLSVRDNGAGVKDLDLLFEPFHTTKQPGDGVGLGLAISSGIVKDLGGRLTARNAESGGAIFEVHLPLFDDTRTEHYRVKAAE